MKKKMTTFAVLVLICTLATPVLAGKSGGSGNQYKHGGGSSLGGSSMNQQQNQYKYQYQYKKNQSTDSSASQTRSQMRTRDPLTHNVETPATTESLTTPTTTE